MSFLKIFSTTTQSEKKDAALSDNLTHINQEMYKKGVELSERNKTLSLLRQVDDIVLRSITNPQAIAQEITNLLIAETDFKFVTLRVYNKQNNCLIVFGFSLSDSISLTEQDVIKNILRIPSDLSLTLDMNTIVQAVKEKSIKVTKSLQSILLPNIPIEGVQEVQRLTEIRSIIVYPLIVREDIVGSLTIALREEEEKLSEHMHDLLERLTRVIGVAIDNALLYNELQIANEKLKELDKMKDEFVSLASHELRTPLTSIRWALSATIVDKNSVLSENQKKNLDIAYNSTDRLIELVNDLLNISRIESGRISVLLQEVNINQLIQDSMNEIMPRATEVGVNVTVQNSEILSPVSADPNKIKEVLINLVGNSLKFTPRGGTVTLSLTQKENLVEVKISDTGYGIKPENMSKLFQKFDYIADAYKNNPQTSGTGLGLYICKSLVEMHGGKIWAESEGENKGTQFYFTLKVFTKEDIPM